MRPKTNLLIFIVLAAIFLVGCSSKGAVNQTTQDYSKTEIALNNTLEKEPEILGPSGCKSNEECASYCLKDPFDCKAWCEVNKDVCEKRGIKIEMPSGIPGSACTADSECMTGLCLDFKCNLPTPENMAKKSGFSLPGGCSSISECANYCSNPKNTMDCLKFCEQLPSFCDSSYRALNAPAECKSCTKCESKDCILDCTYKCYNYMSAGSPDLDALKKDFVFERKYQEPIKAVWEPGPAYNRIGITYFVEDYKNLGVNTYHVIAKYYHKNGTLIHTVDYAIGSKADNEKIANIIKAKRAGFQVVVIAHDLYDLFPDANPNKGEKIDYTSYLDDIEESSIKWAKIAEEYKAEYFVPVNEFEYMLYENGYSAQQACNITNEVYKKIIPKVRETFKGKIYCRVGGMDAKFSCMDFSMCDVFGFTYGFSGSDYQSNFEALFKAGEEVSAREGKSYMMAEAFAFNKDGLQACINLHRAGMQAYKDIAKNGIGYAFMGVIQNNPIDKNDCPITGTELVQDYADFFYWVDKNTK